MKLAVFALGAAALASCGRVGELRPAPGQSLPVKPLLARSTPDAQDLLTPPPYARPERVDEIQSRNRPREPNRFDLPPPDGGAAPVPESEAQAETGPATPQ